MSTLSQLRDRLSTTWESIAEGWEQLRRRASQALTRFNPVTRRQDMQTAEEQDMLRASRWGLLAADLWLDDDQVIVTLEVPGMKKEDFDVVVSDGFLVVRGTKHIRRERSEGRYYSLECAYGEFERAIALPVEVDESRAVANYRDGVLRIRLPRHPRHRTRRITVESA